jgi:hypothetical protein
MVITNRPEGKCPTGLFFSPIYGSENLQILENSPKLANN